jgi:type I restriction enzyme S subunit
MIAGPEAYPAMKDSGVPWLGEVPEHWELSRLKGHLVRNDSGVWGDDADPCGTVVLRSTEQTVDGGWRISNPARIRLARAQIAAALLTPGDLVVTKSSGSEAHIGKTSLVTNDVAALNCCFSNFLQRLRADELIIPAFLWRFLNSPLGREQLVFQSTTTTGLGNLNGTILGNCRFALPPLLEQTAIVRFLDYADRRTRRYIRAKQKLIKLLGEQKQAIIHRAVTRGLDPSVGLKPSGAEWLGDVPEHWEIWRSKRLFIPRKELARPHDIQLSATQAYGVIPQDEYERRVGRRITKIFRHLEKRRHVEIGDFVISMRSFQGGLERAWAAGCIRSSYIVLQPSVRVDANFFTYVFKSRAYIGALQATANFIRDGQDLNFDNFCAVDLALPPIEEQQIIAQAISNAVASTVATAERARDEITLLLEYRTRLIADVVTGKLDVREVAARLPDEPDSPDEPDEPIDAEPETPDDLDEIPEEAAL